MATYESRRYNTPVTDVTKIADGSVNNTEFETLDGVTSDIQTQLNAKLNLSGGALTGALSTNSNISLSDSNHIYVGTGQDIDIVSDGSAGYIRANDLRLTSSTDENYVTAAINGSANLWYDNANKLQTTSSGVNVTGTMAATTVTGNGSGLTSLNASNLSSGTVPEARLPASALGGGLSGGQLFSGSGGTWTAPAGITKIRAIICAGGGSGGAQGQGSYDGQSSGNGGAGGAFYGVLTVVPGTTYTISIGVGATAPTGNNNNSAKPGNTGGSTTAFGVTCTGGAGGTGSFNGFVNPSASGTTGANGSATVIPSGAVTFSSVSRNEIGSVREGVGVPRGVNGANVGDATIPPHLFSGAADTFAPGAGGTAGAKVGATQLIYVPSGGVSGYVEILF